MSDRRTEDERLDTIIDQGVRSLVEQNEPPGHAHRIGTRVAVASAAYDPHVWRPGWLRPVLLTAAMLLLAVAGAWLWTLRDDSSSDVLETRVVKHAPRQAPSAAARMPNLQSAAPSDLRAVHATPPDASTRTARDAAVSRARFEAYLEALRQLPPEVLLRERPTAREPLPAPRPIVISEMAITPLSARATPNNETARGSSSPRGDE